MPKLTLLEVVELGLRPGQAGSQLWACLVMMVSIY